MTRAGLTPVLLLIVLAAVGELLSCAGRPSSVLRVHGWLEGVHVGDRPGGEWLSVSNVGRSRLRIEEVRWSWEGHAHQRSTGIELDPGDDVGLVELLGQEIPPSSRPGLHELLLEEVHVLEEPREHRSIALREVRVPVFVLTAPPPNSAIAWLRRASELCPTGPGRTSLPGRWDELGEEQVPLAVEILEQESACLEAATSAARASTAGYQAYPLRGPGSPHDPVSWNRVFGWLDRAANLRRAQGAHLDSGRRTLEALRLAILLEEATLFGQEPLEWLVSTKITGRETDRALQLLRSGSLSEADRLALGEQWEDTAKRFDELPSQEAVRDWIGGMVLRGTPSFRHHPLGGVLAATYGSIGTASLLTSVDDREKSHQLVRELDEHLRDSNSENRGRPIPDP